MEATIENLNEYIAKTGASQTKVAKALGISAATLSYFLKGTYTGDVDAIVAKVKDFLATEAERERSHQDLQDHPQVLFPCADPPGMRNAHR